MNFINIFFNFLKTVFFLTINQMISLLGIFFLLGYILYFLERITSNCYFKTIGWKGILWTAWIGTPVHELGHALFCILFRHRILSIKFFEPDAYSGTLGYICHTHDNKKYQLIGNFFIGIAPLLFGSLAIYAALYFLIPNSRDIFKIVSSRSDAFHGVIGLQDQLRILWGTSEETLKMLFTPSNLSCYKFWIFLYLTFCIASHIAPSPSDMQGAWQGIGTITGILLIINSITLLLGIDASRYILLLTSKMGFLISLFIFSIVISLLNFIISYTVLSIYLKIKHNDLLNPF